MLQGVGAVSVIKRVWKTVPPLPLLEIVHSSHQNIQGSVTSYHKETCLHRLYPVFPDLFIKPQFTLLSPRIPKEPTLDTDVLMNTVWKSQWLENEHMRVIIQLHLSQVTQASPPLQASISSSLKWVFVVVVLVAQSCPTLCDSMDYSSPGSSVHGVFQASRRSF